MKAMIIWLVVAVPLAWGVAKSVEKARPLFSSSTASPPP
jgi:ABC-type spermidine/putrescine transport system permease subunit I